MPTSNKISTHDMTDPVVQALNAAEVIGDSVAEIKTKVDILGENTLKIVNAINSTTNGLSPIKTSVDNVANTVSTINTNTSNLNTRFTTTRAGYLDLLVNTTYGLSALKTAITSVNTAVSTVDTVADTINSNLNTRLSATRAGYIDYLANSTYGLSAIKTAINNVNTAVSNSGGGLKSVTLTFGKTNSSNLHLLNLTDAQIAGLKAVVMRDFHMDGRDITGPIWAHFGAYNYAETGWKIYTSQENTTLFIYNTTSGMKIGTTGSSSDKYFSGDITFYYIG